MKIMGIDPGLKATGYGVIIVDKSGRVKPVEAGTIEPKQTEALPEKLLKIHTHLTGLVVQHRPDVLVLEKLYSHVKHPVTSSVMGHARGVICLVSAEEKVLLVEESPKRIRKAVVGNGNASKEQTRSVVAETLKISADNLTLDASDALALALGYASMARGIKI